MCGVLCMVLLDCPGGYLRVDHVARTDRGRMPSQLIVAELRTYHGPLHGAQRRCAEFYLINAEIRYWWLMPSDVRASLDLRFSSDPSSPVYDCEDVLFRVGSIPQGRDGAHSSFSLAPSHATVPFHCLLMW